jgi:subtilisin family serine protease
MNRAPVRVAVIDSGVHANHPHVGGVWGGMGIDERGRPHHDFVDRLGHGTAVAAVIREKAPSAEILAIKVFDVELAATAQALVAACDLAREKGSHLVNMSLGTTNQEHEAALTAAVRRLLSSGIRVIAAGEQDGVRWLPGALPGVWAVSLDWTLAREQCQSFTDASGATTFRASGYPRPIPGVPPERNLKGLSFAVANVTGWVAARYFEM